MKVRSRATLWLAIGLLAASLTGPAAGQPAPPRVVWVSASPHADGGEFFEQFRQGLLEIGHVEGRTIRLESAWSDGTRQRTDKLIAEVIATSPGIVVTQGAAGPLAGKATSTIPVVFGYSGDPVEAGMVQSLSRPGRNVTGISYMTLELVGKRMELLKELLPKARRIAVVALPDHPGDSAERRVSEAAASRLGLAIDYFELGRRATVEDILTAIDNSRSDAVMFFPTQTVIANRVRIAEWSFKRKVPTISGWARFADGGNLISYGPNLGDASRRLAFYVDRILKGTRPGDLPVEFPTRVELVINQKAAKALGVAIPASVMIRADRVIE
jgi:putative tryptophan/tyrosine transport system substrate-binding protein